jgi:hypothetical protein
MKNEDFNILKMYKIIICNKCSTPQYVRKTQKHRKCPRCGYNISCQKSKSFGEAETEPEASQVVRNMKTPGEIGQRLAKLQAKHQNQTSSVNNYKILSNLITEMIGVFPQAMPQNLLLENAKKLGIEDELFILNLIEKMNLEGLVLINKDFRHNVVLKFPKVPFSFGKLSVHKPASSTEFRKKKWEK